MVESLSDPLHPTVVCTLNNAFPRTFISANEVSLTTNSSGNDPIDGQTTVQRLKLATGAQPVNVVTFPGDAVAMGFSPDGTSLAYLAYTNEPGNTNRLWLKVGDSPARALTPLIPLLGRDGSLDDQLLVQFSPDGKYVLMVDTWVAGPAPASPDLAMMQVRSTADGSLVWVPPAALQISGNKGGSSITMAAWSHTGDRVFYRDSSGVHVWDPSGNVSMMAAGLSWSWPSVAPDDSVIAYPVGVVTAPSIEVRNLTTSTVTPIDGPRGYAVLLSATTMLEAHMVPDTQMGPPFVPGAWFVWNLATGSETELPAATQNFSVLLDGGPSPLELWST
ncbi:MAG TPA: hypothetical protein VGV88_06130 [Candidatus Dormibacteraeota bacterium]|nr:hypothetical protein [Candidatus Dormibacteraeota bacterium]